MDTWLPALIGVGGVVLGVLLDRIFELWRDRSSLALSLAFGTRPISWSEGGTVRGDEYLLLTVTNAGRRPTQVSSAGLMLDDETTIPSLVDQLGQAVFPATLDERNPSVTASYNYDEIRGRIRGLNAMPTRLICWLGTGRRKTTRISTDWLRALTAPVPSEEVVDQEVTS